MSFTVTNVGRLSHESIKIHGGTFITSAPSVTDPEGSLIIICDKHPKKPITVKANYWSQDTLIDSIYKALESCPDCVEEREQKMSWKNTRWPEGAEI